MAARRFPLINRLGTLLRAASAETITGLWTFSNQSSVFGGVTASNLVDKSAAETISAEWDFTTNPKIDAAGIDTGTFADARISAGSVSQHAGAGNLLDKTAAETIIGAWSFEPIADEKLRITDAEADGQAAVMFLSFWDQDSRQGVVGFGSSGDEKLRIRTDAVTAGIYLLPGNSILDLDSVIRMEERGNALADVAAYGQWWVKNDTPAVPRFTDDAGVDGVLGQINILQNVTGAWNFLAGPSGTDFLDSGGTVGLNIAHDGGNDVTITTVGTVQDMKFQGATVQYDFDNDVVVTGPLIATSYGGITEANLVDKAAVEAITGDWTFDGNHPVEGRIAGRNVLRSIRLRLQPGATPGTNINLTNRSATESSGFNAPSITNATDLAKSGSSGSFALDSTGKVLTMDFTPAVVGIVSAGFAIHGLNNSSSTAIYDPDVRVTSGNLVLRLFVHGSTATADLTAILQSGDLGDLQITFITST